MADDKVVNIHIKVKGPRRDFKMTVTEIEEFARLQMEDEELPFEVVSVRAEVENQR
jgi:hypothetical protein